MWHQENNMRKKLRRNRLTLMVLNPGGIHSAKLSLEISIKNV